MICAWAGSSPLAPSPLRTGSNDEALRQVLSTKSKPKFCPGNPPSPKSASPSPYTSQSVMPSTLNVRAEGGSEMSH
ncbi:hypothetical protein N431DRAFT_433255 [Stipitochalara longipes BDJ]|nr:hypothetical protein N431DRAFT_433255 [Stipitochalara longipes BDJ]